MTTISSEMTISSLAERLGVSAERLMQLLKNAGIVVTGVDATLSEREQKLVLKSVESLMPHSVGQRQKVTLVRKKVSNIKLGKNKSVRVDVRSKKTYVKRDASAAEVEPVDEPKLNEVVEELLLPEQDSSTVTLASEPTAESALSTDVITPIEEHLSVESVTSLEQNPQVVLPVVATELQDAAEKKPARAKDARKDKERERDPEQIRDKDFSAKKNKNVKKQRVAYAESGDDDLDLVGRPRRRGGSKKQKKSAAAEAVDALRSKHAFEKPTDPVILTVDVPETITVGDLAARLSVKAADLIKTLMRLGTMATINQVLDQETAVILVEELGHQAKIIKEQSLDDLVAVEYQVEETERAPVVTVMGHVDHGKTSLLDALRSAKVALKESGGITQHIGAYQVEKNAHKITFLDTPGHEAFSAMRARGANVTDIVLLIVAADDGVRPQTIEAISHAKASDAAMVVVINKIDKPEANIERVKQELLSHEVVLEEYGGEVPFVCVSAKTGEGLDALLDTILLVSEMLELKAPHEGPAKAVVIESRIEKGRGPVATILVQSGCLKQGDMFLAGTEYGRVRVMSDDSGKPLKKAMPSQPVEVIGLGGVPNAGEECVVVDDERRAREVANYRVVKQRELRLSRSSTSLEDLMSRIKTADSSVVNLVLKADVQGSVEALVTALEKLSTESIQTKVIVSGVGGISESDINLAIAAKAITIGFNVRADASARALADREGLNIHYFSVIYDVIDRVKAAMEGLLKPVYEEKILGVAKVREVFHSSKFGTIAGCIVAEGAVRRGKPIRVLRENVVIFTGELESLRRFKDDVNEVKQGIECGIAVKSFPKLQEADQIEVYDRVLVERKVEGGKG